MNMHRRRSAVSAHAAMRCGIELSADEILGEPDDQVVIHGHLHTFAEGLLAPACAPAVGDIAAPCVQPLRRAIVEQADSDAQRGDAPIAGELLGGVHQQCCDAPPPKWPGHGDLVQQRDAATPESGVVGLPHDRHVTDDTGIAGRDKARAIRFRVLGQVPARLGLAVSDPR